MNMKNFYLEAEFKSPCINFKTDGELSISGRSIPENPLLVYEPALEWLAEFFKHKHEKVTLNVAVDLFNSSSGKLLFVLFKELNKYGSVHGNVEIFWHFHEGDDSMGEAGEDFKSMLKIPFHLVEK
jgi:hypothetical protein